ncbi:winged helix-turn-helix domain-containing protein [Acuticoccus sp. M5D2P5]|uniref:winged helix-turn-helix domain-containing protein n=1 Tax=Acuticoccus kalidii TaxID=2910977 RepID=UPI001F30B57D|nr:winged helix-turn-helix domain-containing protein [Acuticoccus kalidii]MCF3936264.1 winged helix-turn-helix domain-containing protein [Acuticoccus kalidii]
MAEKAPSADLHLRLTFGDDAMIGPGKADLLELIRETGSISAAGRRMGMSYKRAWTLVETMNTIFEEPLVARVRGGPAGGGAQLTEEGERVLAHYRRLQGRAFAAGEEDIAAIRAMLRDIANEK